MKNIKVFATPKAYELLSDQKAQDIIKRAIEGLFKVASSGSCDEMIIEDCPLGISALWTTNYDSATYILIYDHKGNAIFHSLNLEMFHEKLETSIQVHFD